MRFHCAVFYQSVRDVFGHMGQSFGRLDSKMLARNKSSIAGSLWAASGLAPSVSGLGPVPLGGTFSQSYTEGSSWNARLRARCVGAPHSHTVLGVFCSFIFL